FFASRRRHTRSKRDWSSDVCSSDLLGLPRDSAEPATRKIAAIRTCEEAFAAHARAAGPGGRDAQFLAVLFEQPYCRISTVVERCQVSRQTASAWLQSLVDAGLLRDV